MNIENEFKNKTIKEITKKIVELKYNIKLLNNEIDILNKIKANKKLISPYETLNDVQENYINDISKLIKLDVDEARDLFVRLEDIKANYYYSPVRGGNQIIVSDDGSYLLAASIMNFDKLKNAFINGKRNGNIRGK